jgi:hypothetical protein
VHGVAKVCSQAATLKERANVWLVLKQFEVEAISIHAG